MRAKDLIRWSLRTVDQWMAGAAEDLRDAPLAQPTANGGNHPLWIVGHVAWVEGNFRAMLFGEPNPLDAWKPIFGMGTTPTADAAAYPSYDEVLSAYKDLRADNLARLEALSDEDLDRHPANVPDFFGDDMRPTGRILLMLAMHQMAHLGQLAVVRRALGRPWRF